MNGGVQGRRVAAGGQDADPLHRVTRAVNGEMRIEWSVAEAELGLRGIGGAWHSAFAPLLPAANARREIILERAERHDHGEPRRLGSGFSMCSSSSIGS